MKTDFAISKNNFETPVKAWNSSIYRNTLSFGAKLPKQLSSDVTQLKVIDKSLNTKFLKGLMDIEGKTPLETADLIKNAMLKAMGYKHPELVKIVYKEECYDTKAGYDICTGSINLNPNALTKTRLIGAIRHELEHLNQYVKTYKAKGEKAIVNALLNNKEFDNNFYKIMFEDVSLEGFDTDKYMNAILDYKELYKLNKDNFNTLIEYVNNPLEFDAYKAERKVLDILGDSTVTGFDRCPKNYRRLIKLMESHGINSSSLYGQDEVWEDLFYLASAHTVLPFEEFKKLIIQKATLSKLSNEEKERVFNTEDNIQKRMDKSKDNYTQASLEIENWMKNGKFSSEEVIQDIFHIDLYNL